MNKAQFIIIIIFVFSIINCDGFNKSDIRTNSGQYQPPVVSAEKPKQPFGFNDRMLILALGGFPLLMGIWAANTWFKDYNRAKNSLNWIKLHGKLLNKEIVACPNTESGANLCETYAPEVKYEFIYEGSRYHGHKLDNLSRPCHGDQVKSQKILDMLPDINEQVDVYYDPQGKMSVLIPGAKGMSYFGIISAVVLLIIGSFIIRFVFS